MPVANIHVLAGHPRPLLKAMLREFAAVFAKTMGAPTDRLQVWVTEVDPELFVVAGENADEVLQRQARGDTEVPFIRMALMEGRPTELLHRVMADLSEVVSRHLGGDPQRVRVQIDQVHPDRWAIGGVPASVSRAAEIARMAQA